MDPCPFVRFVIGNLCLKFSGGGSTNPPPSSCYCKIKLKNIPTQIADVSNCSDNDVNQVNDQVQSCFNFKKSYFDKLVEKGNGLKIEVYSGRKGNPICGVGSAKLIGVVSVGLDSKVVDGGNNSTNSSGGCSMVVQNGWVRVDDVSSKKAVQLHMNIRVEADPRFVFEFDGEPECSPQVFQVNGNIRQAVFTCKFSFRNNGERNLRSGRSISEANNNSGNWLLSIGSGDKSSNMYSTAIKERKGWSITIHDLSGSPVAMASMVTPFVPSHGTDHVRKSNPGAWLILRPGHNTWKPWGRLEAWRHNDNLNLGYRFELLPDAAITGLHPITLSNSTISSKQGGTFTIDIANNGGISPLTTPTGSFDSGSGSSSGSDFWSGSWAQLMYHGFVMSSKVAGGGGGRSCNIKPEVEVGAQHVTCTEDAAAFVALAAAVDLSVDACQPFSRKLRKELRHDCE